MLFTTNTFAQNFEGNWSGILKISPLQSLKMTLEVNKNGNSYNATMISLSQGNAKIPSNKTTVSGKNITIELSSIGAKYIAVCKENSLTGKFFKWEKNLT